VFDVLPDRTALQEKDKLVAEVMRYVLFKMQQTYTYTAKSTKASEGDKII
jgi:hypothetical protein